MYSPSVEDISLPFVFANSSGMVVSLCLNLFGGGQTAHRA